MNDGLIPSLDGITPPFCRFRNSCCDHPSAPPRTSASAPPPRLGTMARGATLPARPLHLLAYDERSKRFELGDEALEALRAIKGPVGVLSVCGRARQGKSFILNQLAGAAASNDAGFKVGPTVRPCTKGLWIWSAPIPCRTPEGDPYHLVLLDTEGIDAYDQTGQYSTQIFSMAVLLSSLFVYNQMGGIDEAALDRLSLVTEMTKHIRVKSGGEAGGGAARDPSELARFSPSFVWLLRDFYLDLEDDAASITPAQYLESALRNVPGGGPAVEAKNAIRDSIRGLFPERECFPLVRPVNDEKALRALDAVPPSELRPEFREGLDTLVRMLFRRCRPKAVGPDVLNGAALAGMATQYVAAINDGAVPAIATAWQSVAEAECRRAAEAGESAYETIFFPIADAAPADDGPLDAAHARALDAARAAFDDAAVGGAEPRRSAAAKMEAALDRRRREYVAARRAKAAAECARLLAAASQRVHAVANAADATPELATRAVEAEAEAYLAEAQGPARHETLVAWLRDSHRHAVVALAARVAQRLEGELARERERADREASDRAAGRERWESAESRAAAAEKAAAEANANANANADAARRASARLQETEARAAVAAASATSEAMATRREHAATEMSLRDALESEKSRADRAGEESRRLERELAEARRDCVEARAGRDAAAGETERSLRAAEQRAAEERRRRESAESSAKDAAARATAEANEARATAAGRVAAAEARAAEAERRAKLAETKLAELKRLSDRAARMSTDGPGVGEDVRAETAARGGVDATLERWRAEAEAAAAKAAGAEAAAATSVRSPVGSPVKRRREKSPEKLEPELEPEPEPEFVDAEEGDADAPEEEDGVDARAEAEAMTVNQLKHELQVMGLAHLYAGKRGVKKANLVDMYVNKG